MSRRHRLTPDKITDRALSIADRDGLDRVTLRALAAELDVTPMALYNHFPNKAALHAAMLGRALAGVTLATTTANCWEEVMRTIALGIAHSLNEHPNWIPLFAQDTTPPDPGLALIDRLIETMQADGFEIHDIVMAYVLVVSFSLGSVFTERKFLGGEDPIDARIEMLKQLMATSGAKYQNLSSVADAIERWDFDEMLTEGVNALIAQVRLRKNRPGRSGTRH